MPLNLSLVAAFAVAATRVVWGTGSGEVATVGVKRYFVRSFQGTNKIGNCILRIDEVAIHIVAGIEKNVDVRAGNQ